jgi:flagellar hook-length control protein FliK
MLSSDKAANGLQTISSPLGSSGWTEEFSQKITWMGTQQNQVAELHLNPPNLGPLDVVLKISDNQATALFTSPHSAVREAVENALPRLREILADSGITLGNTMVSDQSPRDRSADGLADFGSGAMAQRETSDDALKAEGLLPSSAQTIPVRRHNGMVDTFA